MTQNVFITGANPDVFSEALKDLPPWATENTARAIEKQLNSQTKSLSTLVKKYGKGGKGSGEDPNLIDELNKLRIEEAKQRKKDREYNKKKQKEDKEKRDKELIWGKRFETSNQVLAAVLLNLKIVGNEVKDTLKKNIKSYDELQAGGLNVVSGLDGVGQGFEALQQITALTGVRYTELQSSMLKYNTAINAFGVGKFAKTVGMASKDLTKFGFSSKEAADLTGVYLESQRGVRDVTNKSEKETAEEVVKFGERITNASMATGMMRSRILENLDAISKSTTAALLAGQVSKQQSDNLQAFGATFKDQKLGNQILEMMADPVKALNSTFTTLTKSGGGAFAQSLTDFTEKLKRSGKSPEEMQESLSDFVKANEATIDQQMQQNRLLEQSGNASAGAANQILNSLKQNAIAFKKLDPIEKAKLEKTNKASKDLANAQERLASQWQRTFSNLIPVLDALTWGLNAVSTVIEGVVDFLGPTTTSILGIGAIIMGGAGILLKSFTAISSALELILPIILSPFKMLANGVGRIAGIVMDFVPTISSLFTKLGAGFRWLVGIVMDFVPALLNPFTKLIAAFTAGYAIGTFIYEMIKDFQWFNTMMATIFRGLDHVLQYIPGSIGSDAKDRLENRAKAGPATSAKSTEISIPKNPTPSTINSPSAPPTAVGAADPTSSKQAIPPSTPVGPGIEKPPSNTDINSLLAFQNSMMEQLLLKTSSLLSVNQDQLKYAKNSA